MSKRKAASSANGNGKGKGSESKKNKKETTKPDNDKFQPLTLSIMRSKIQDLSKKIPTIPDGGLKPDEHESVKKFATEIQAITEELSLLLGCVSTATYKWGSDRSGAGKQSVELLMEELQTSLSQIGSACNTAKISDVACPYMDLRLHKTIITKNENGQEVRENMFKSVEVDPHGQQLSREILCRNVNNLCLGIQTGFHKICICIDDYIKASKKDSESSRGGYSY